MKKKTCRKPDGFALFSVLAIIATLAIMLGMLAKLGGQRAFTARRLTNQVRALAYAEAGIEYAYSILSADFDQKDNPDAFLLEDDESSTVALNYNSEGFFHLMMGQLGGDEGGTNSSSTQSSYGDGSFSLTITPVSNKYVIINSVGRAGDVTRTAEILVNDENAGSGGSTPGTGYSNMEGFNYAILCGGEFDFSGCGTISAPEGALFHANGEMFLRGNTDALINLSSSSLIQINNNVTVGGDVTADDFGRTKWNKVTVLGTKTQTTVAPVGIPDIDLTPYYNWALDHGEVHNGFTTTSDITPNGGILWVNGDFHISAHATIHGSVIATGDINLSGQIDIEPTTAVFSVVSRDGDIHVTSSGTINGLMYAKTGELQHTANGEIVGQVIINGNIKKAGNSDIITGYSPSIPPPGGPGSTTPTTAWPVVSVWQR